MENLLNADDWLFPETLVEIDNILFVLYLLLTLFSSVWLSGAIPMHHEHERRSYARATFTTAIPHGVASPCCFRDRWGCNILFPFGGSKALQGLL